MAPEASGAWPIIGHLHLLGGSKNLPHLLFGTMADKYGPVFSIRLGLKRAVVVSSWEMAKECFTTHDLALASRPELVAAKYLGYNYAMFGLSPHGAYWREVSHSRATLEPPARVAEECPNLRGGDMHEGTIRALGKEEKRSRRCFGGHEAMVWALVSERDS